MNWVRKLARDVEQHSIGSKIHMSFLLMVTGIILISFLTMFTAHDHLNEYHVLAARASRANRMYPIAREVIGTEAYYLVAGRQTVKTTTLLDHWAYLDREIASLMEECDSKDSRLQLSIIQRTLGTLEHYCTLLLEQSQKSEDWTKQNVTCEQIREVSALIAEQIDQYIYVELQHMEKLDERIQAREKWLILTDLGVIAVVLLAMTLVQLLIDRSISVPINALVENTRRLSEGEFHAYVETSGTHEIAVLNDSFKRMVEKLQLLMQELEENTRTREQLELRLMQEQINPHFLYNTLEIIVWLAESGDKDKVIGVVKSLSRFFRVVLSQGRATISVREELSCIESYLYIQQTRYADILTYEIDAAPSTLDLEIQKLSLQPLVENALYHGIKNKRGGGKIYVQARLAGDRLRVLVRDTGIGMAPDKLRALRETIDHARPMDKVFGLSNTQKRIQLTYGEKYGISLQSEEGAGTTVILQIPARRIDRPS
ncbi:MAG: sensor histidine kinase [Eubacteriales bacterium]|nr:sensor histidine kinase [Eubacteriales bacterium]